MTLLPGTKVIARYNLDGANPHDECVIILRDKENNYLALCTQDEAEDMFWAREEDFTVPYKASDLVYHNTGRVCVFLQEDENGYCISHYGTCEEPFYVTARDITKIPFNTYDGTQ